MNQAIQTEAHRRHAFADAAHQTSGIRRSYIHSTQTWHYSNLYNRHAAPIDEVIIIVTRDDEPIGEFSVQWFEGVTTPQLRVFNDALPAARECSDMFNAIVDRNLKFPHGEHLCQLLTELGFIDATVRKCPFEM